MNASNSHLSKEFFDLVKAIGESRSKQEEDRIIVNEVNTLKARLSEPSISPKKMKEYLIRGVYVEMLGHDASFSYIHAVKFTHEKNSLCKRMGYLSCNLCLHKDHELMLLLVNTIQRDLNSCNKLDVSAALTCVCRLVNQEMIPAVFPIVKNLLSHSSEIVRKKACMALYKLYKIQPEIITEAKEYVRRALCDPNPSVMGCSLYLIHELAKANQSSCKDLVPSLVSILKQICEHRLPREYDYHRIPAPWLQIKLLSLLATLGAADQKACEQMYEVLQDVMRRADVGVNVAYAVISECVKTITAIYPSHQLMELAAASISRFISAENHNLKYVGVTGLESIVQVNPAFATTHQLVVVDCLEDPDDTLKRKTLDLLYRMTNPQNVTVVAEKFLFHLRASVDQHLRRDLASKVTQLAERYAPNNHWYLDTMNAVFEMAGNLVDPETAYNLIQLIAEGPNADEVQDKEFRTYAVDTYIKLCENIQSMPDILVKVIAWILGEYGSLTTVEGYSLEDVVDLLCDCVDRSFEEVDTRGWIITAIMKLCSMNGIIKTTSVEDVIKKYGKSQNTDIQQRCNECKMLFQMPATMREVLPYDAFSEDIQVDADLKFLDDFVKKALAAGAPPYIPVEQRKQVVSIPVASSGHDIPISPLKFTPYETPSRQASSLDLASTTMTDNTACQFSHQLNTLGNISTTTVGFNVQGPRRWGPSGYNKQSSLNAGSMKCVTAMHKSDNNFATNSPLNYSSYPSSSALNHNKQTNVVQHELTEREKIAFALFSGIGETKGYTTSSATISTPLETCETEGSDISSRQIIDVTFTDISNENKTNKTRNGIETNKTHNGIETNKTQNVTDVEVNLLDLDYPTTNIQEEELLVEDSKNKIKSQKNNNLQNNNNNIGNSNEDELLLLDLDTEKTDNVTNNWIIEPIYDTIDEVGAKWPSLLSERRANLHYPSCSSCEIFVRKLADAINVHIVQIIGDEGIAAARISNIPESLVYIHSKVNAPSIELIIKGSHDKVTEIVLQKCYQTFS